MNEVFADAFYWVALANPSDEWHAAVTDFDEKNNDALVTSEQVLTEFLNYYSGWGAYRRRAVHRMVGTILTHPAIITVGQSSASFLSGLRLYGEREDKGYSLTDCVSMNIMRERGITSILTRDKHFQQEGFTNLF
jgi:uncharacterized protein